MQRKRCYVLLILLLVLSLTAYPGLDFGQQLYSKLLMEQTPKCPWDQRPLVVSIHLLKWSQRAILSLRPLAALESVIHSNKMVPLSSLNKGSTNKKPLSWKEGEKKAWKTVFKCPLTCDCDTKQWPHLALASCRSSGTSAPAIQSGVCCRGGGRRPAGHKPSRRSCPCHQHQGNKPLNSQVFQLQRRIAVLSSSFCLWKYNV